MTVSFDVYDFKDIQKVCSPVVSTTEEDLRRAYLNYICLTVSEIEKTCTAYGCNGYMASRITVPCKIEGEAPKHILFSPVKVIPKTRRVTVEPVTVGEEHSVRFIFYNECDLRLGEVVQTVIDSEPIDYADMFKRTDKAVCERCGPDGRYRIAVNPKYLLNILNGMKDAKSVLLYFGDATQAMRIYPRGYDGCENTDAFLLPVRIF